MTPAWKILAWFVGVGTLLFLSGWWTKAQWSECRNAGFSIGYCMQHLD